ncbi:hypothetical protein PENDEC_c027G01289 [Penicillium decumbens]|uniref:Only prolin and serin are matching in the corresponding protein n=1 Tax=Penicillium decumbens TaxID=69771 RepID=A0A1V6NZG5_PENDC|nr:hypothetical protein PENDEC_c027G01289 [Penicillium decumbens]
MPLNVNTSAPASPAVSLFSAPGHNRVSSSMSSLVSSGPLGNSIDSPGRNHLTGVKEEPITRDSLEDHYFRLFPPLTHRAGSMADFLQEHFDCADGSCFPMEPSGSYDLSDNCMDLPLTKRRSDSASVKGISRINSHISTMSTRWSRRRASGSPEREGFPDARRSRASSAASSALASPVVSPISVSRVDSYIPPSPARTTFEERRSDSNVRPIDITRANSLSQDDNDGLQATTPLLPPPLGDDPTSMVTSRVQSPLQSPSVADVSESGQYSMRSIPGFTGMPSPPLSSKPSVASISRPSASTSRTVSGDSPSAPFVLSDPNDEWANKLGHANFTIQPEPYQPMVCDIDRFHQLRADWDIARCNFAKHLVRTGEHYGVTSNIYQLTGEKWECINDQWRSQHKSMLNQLGSEDGVALTLTQSHLQPREQVCIPGLHDNAKFPEMGDEDIVGPMTVAPATGCRSNPLKKRNFFRFFQDLVSRP